MATKTFDPSKFRKSVTKSIPGMSVGFRDPDTWVSTGSYTLNKLISGSFYKGFPLGKVSMMAGESGAGKSYIASGNVIKDAQEQGIFVVCIDTENALDQAWLEALGVDTSEEKMLKLNMAMIDDVGKTVSEFVQAYRTDYADIPQEDRPKVMFVIDSLGMLMTPTEVKQFDEGNTSKGDMGRKAKALKAFITNCVNMIGDLNIGMLCTNHTYASQDMFDPDDKLSGGAGMIYASSIVVGMKKQKLKEDETGTKVKEELGIKAACKVLKSRYSKPFESVKLHIPYDSGMSPYSGIVEYFETRGIFTKTGNKLEYVSTETGEVYKEFKKQWYAKKDLLDMVMREAEEQDNMVKVEPKLSDMDESEAE